MYCRNLLCLGTLFFCELATTNAAPTKTESNAAPTSTPIPPSKDPWYSPPSGYEAKPPGHVLRIRNAPGNLTSIFDHSSAVYNLLYRTIDAHYEAFWAVTTLFVPKHSNGSALLSYQIPYNTADVDASPSALLSTSFGSTGLVHSDIQTALSKGWYVNVPDFEGPLASFGEVVQEGAAVLDSIRAVLNKPQGNLSADARYALWGYSGGSIASESALELQGSYAPELTISGAALGGVVPNLTDAAPYANRVFKGYFAGLVPEILLGLSAQFPEVREYLLSQLKPAYKAKFLKAEKMGIEEAFAYYNGTDVFGFFKNGDAVIRSPTWQKLSNQNGVLGYHGIPQAPLYVYKAIGDELSPVDQTDALVDRYCGVDVDIVYERNTVGGHLAEETNGDARAFQWLGKFLDGSSQPGGCLIRNVTVGSDKSPL